MCTADDAPTEAHRTFPAGNIIDNYDHLYVFSKLSVALLMKLARSGPTRTYVCRHLTTEAVKVKGKMFALNSELHDHRSAFEMDYT